MKKLLLTGFEPFLKYAINPTMDVIKYFNNKEVNGYKIVGVILSVDFSKSGKQLIEKIDEIKPDAIISLGLSGGRFKLKPERIAINCNDGPADNTGWKPNGEKIFQDGEDGIFSKLPIEKMVKQLTNANLPAEISNTAGTYLCNNVMYHGLYHTKKQEMLIPAGFIHIPASHELAIEHGKIPSWSQDELNRAIEICIQTL